MRTAIRIVLAWALAATAAHGQTAGWPGVDLQAPHFEPQTLFLASEPPVPIAAPDRPIQLTGLPTVDASNCGCDTDFYLGEAFDAAARDSKTFGKNFARLEYQLETRGFDVIHFMGGSALPFGFNIWGFIDLEGLDSPGANREDISRFFLEIDIKRKLGKEWGLIGEFNDLQGDGNAIARLGFFYLPQSPFIKNHDAFLFFKVFPYESDGRGIQVSFAWNKNFPRIWDGRFSAGGFCDFNFKSGATGERTVIVTEHQLRVRVVEQLYVIAEARLNEFLGDDRDYGTGFGVQYRF